MNAKKTVDTYSNLLSDVATEITQNCSDRSSVMELYLGSGLPQLQLALFKPILLENYAFFCFLLADDELRQQLQLDSEDLIESLGLDVKTFLHDRFDEYAATADCTTLYVEYCVFVFNTKRNASNQESVHEGDFSALEGKTLLTLQLSAHKMQEVTEST